MLMLQLRGISCLLISFPVLSLMLLQLLFYQRFFCDLVLILFDPSFCLGGICTEMKIVGTAASTLDLTTPTPPIQTLAAAGAAVHLSAVRCHPENIKKLLVSWTVAPGAAETRQPQFGISRLHVWIWACHGRLVLPFSCLVLWKDFCFWSTAR